MATNKQTLQIGTASWALFPENVAVGPGAIATVPTGDSFPPTTEWRSISSGDNSFQALVTAADSNVDQVLDLGANEGIGYAFTEEDDDPASFTRGFYGTGNLKIINARLSGGRVLPTWVDQGGGVFRHAFDLSIYDATTNPGGRTTVFNPQAYMYDTDGDTRTTMGVWPAPPASHDQFRRTWNPNWLHLKDTAIDLCTVHTVLGDDVTGFGATITGITITDATMVATLRAKFLEITTAGYTDTSVTLYMLCGQNRIEFARVASYVDNTTTVTINVTAPSGNVFYPGYLRLAILAHPVDVLNEGDYAIDYDNNELVYKFPGGVSHGRMQFSVGNSCYISTTQTDDSDVTFENCELSGWGNAGSTIKVEGTNDVVIDKCTVNYMADGIYCTTMTQCIVDDWYGIACTTAAASGAATFLMEKNSFGPHADQRSCIYISTIHPEVTSTIRPTVVKDNLFSLPLSTHGQGVSVYENTWQNAELSHNVFVDCMSPMSFQPNGPNYDLATFKFENNLTVKTKDAYIVQGQQGHAFNSSNDDYVVDPGAVGTQEVHWRYNTVWADPSVATTMAEYSQTQAVNLIGLRQSTVYVENNVLTSVGTPYFALATKLNSDGHYHANNLITTPSPTYGQNAYGANDLADADALGRIMQTRKPEVQGIYTTAATDGGRIGIRWDSTPDMLSVANLPKNWYEYFPAEVLPAIDPADFSLVLGGEDLRVPTIRLTRTFAPFLASGSDDQVEMWVDVGNVVEHGTYADGSWWVVPASGTTVRIIDASHTGDEAILTDAEFTGGTTDFTVARNGVDINPMYGPKLTVDYTKTNLEDQPKYNSSYSDDWDTAAILAAGRGRCSDNRMNVDTTAVLADTVMNWDFDWVSFRARRDALNGAGTYLTLNTDDCMLLTDSMWDPTDKDFIGMNSHIAATPSTWQGRSAIRYQQALMVRATAPAADAFRPPVQWDVAKGPRPELAWSDLVLDPATVLAGITPVGNSTYPCLNSAADYIAAGKLTSYPDLDTHSPCPMIHANYYYSASLAMYSVALGNDSSYGGEFSGAIQYPWSKAAEAYIAADSTSGDAWIRKALQHGIDAQGTVQCQVAAAFGGAGQTTGIIGPPAMLAARFFGQTDRTSIAKLYRWGWDVTEVDWNGWTDRQQRNAVSSMSYEENVCKTYNQLVSDYSADPEYRVPGHSYIALGADRMTLTTHAQSITDEYCDNEGVLSTPGGGTPTVTIQTSNTNGQYDWDNLPTGLGRLDFSAPWAFPDADGNSRGGNATNLIGCTVKVDGLEYFIVGASQNINTEVWDADVAGQAAAQRAHIYVTPDLPATITDPLIEMYAIRSTYQDTPIYTREPDSPLKQAWVSPSPWSDNYATFLHKGNAFPYLLMARMDGNITELGRTGELLTKYWNTYNGDDPLFSWLCYGQEYKLGGATSSLLRSTQLSGNILKPDPLPAP